MDSLVFLMIVVASSVLALSWCAQRHNLRSRHMPEPVHTLSACQGLLALVGSIQQHRGMSSAVLSGDPDFAERQQKKAAEIDAQIPRLFELMRAETLHGSSCVTRNDLKLFAFHWHELAGKLPTLSVEQSIARHGLLIGRLLKWLALVGEKRLLGGRGVAPGNALMRNYLVRLPTLSEYLGQVRALGMCVATNHGCTAVVRVRLMFLISHAEALLAQAMTTGGYSLEAERASQGVQQMARVVRTQMLLSSNVAISADEYFRIGTEAIDSVFKWIEVSGHSIRILLEEARPAATRVSHAC